MFHKIKSIIDSSINSEFTIERIYLTSGLENKDIIYSLDRKGVVLECVPRPGFFELELSVGNLEHLGYYLNYENFLKRNKYEIVNSENFYIQKAEKYLNEDLGFYSSYRLIVSLICSLENLSTYNYKKNGIKRSFFKGDKDILTLSYDYSYETVLKVEVKQQERINDFLQYISSGKSKERDYLFVNELVEFLVSETEQNRFEKLLLEFEVFFDKAENAYEYYLRNFSSNKLKIEIDLKALEYTQKIQGVMNDSQTRLIAIPTAFVLSVGVINFEEINSYKNIVIFFSLLIFGVIVQLFLNNQRTALNFIEENIGSYKRSFSKVNRKEIEKGFVKVDKEVKKQFKRLLIVNVLLWAIPVVFLILIITSAFGCSLISIFVALIKTTLCIF